MIARIEYKIKECINGIFSREELEFISYFMNEKKSIVEGVLDLLKYSDSSSDSSSIIIEGVSLRSHIRISSSINKKINGVEKWD